MRTLGIVLAAGLFLSAGCDGSDIQDSQPDAEVVVDFADASPPIVVDAAPPIEPDAPVSEADAGGGIGDVGLACSLEDVQPILECAAENCLEELQGGDILTCVTLNCGLLLLGLPPECSQCILTGLTDSSMALDACVSGLDGLGGGLNLPQP